MIIQTNTLEAIRPLTADERLASWAWRYLSAGYHHNPEGTYAQTRSHDSGPMPMDRTVRDCGHTAT